MTVVLTDRIGKSVTLPHIRGMAISSERVLLLVLPNGSLVRREPDKWVAIQVKD